MAGLSSLAAALVVILAVAATLVALREGHRRREAVAEQRQLRHQVYALDMDAAMRAWQEAVVQRVEEILDRWRPIEGQEDLRGFEWYYLWRNCQRGKECATYRHSVGLDDNPAFTADGRFLAVLEGSTYVLLDAATARHVRREPLPTAGMNWTEMSRDATLVATAGENDGQPTVRLWRLIPDRQELELEGPFPQVRTLLFSPDGTWLAGACADHSVQFWETSSGKQVARLDTATTNDGQPSFSELLMLAISADRRLLATVVDRTRPVIWDIPHNCKLRELAGHGAPSFSAAYSPDGAVLATSAWDNTVKLWDIASGLLLRTLTGHQDWMGRVTFSHDGSTLASCSTDNTVRLWHMPGGEEIETLQGHADNVDFVAFSPDGTVLASDCSIEGTTKLWRLDEVDRCSVLAGHEIYVQSVAISPDESTIASGDTEGEIRIWNAHQGRQLHLLTAHENQVNHLAFSPQGEWLASSSTDQSVIVWATASWTPRMRIDMRPATPSMAVFSADGASLISAWENGVVSQRRVKDLQEFRRLDTGEEGGMALASSPDCKLLATGHRSGAVWLWDSGTSRPVGSLPSQGQPILDLAFSPDGSLLASSVKGGGVHIWNIATRLEHGSAMKHLADVYRVKFLPDGTTLVSSSQDHTIGLWDVANGIERGVLRGTNGGVRDVAVSRSGRLLASAGGDLKVRLWRAASPMEVEAAEND